MNQILGGNSFEADYLQKLKVETTQTLLEAGAISEV